MNLRNYAEGEACLIWSPVCLGSSESVVLCHIRLMGISGMGHKCPDLLAAWGCAACHRYVDSGPAPLEERQLLLLKGMARTQNQLIERGVVRW